MTRGTATVLFTDLVGSTELSVRFGEVYEVARRAHDALLRAAIEADHGTLVKGTGDGVMATFDGVSDGVAFARAAQAAIHRLNQRQPVSLSVRVGLSVGDVSFEGGDCFGEAVTQAARLCAIADGGQIFATHVVRALCGGPRATGFIDSGPLLLKGLPDLVDVVEIQWHRPEATATPLPTRLPADQASFVGRSIELDQLHHAFNRINDLGQREIVLIAGEPGVGKTSMVSRAIRLWFDAGATIAMGRCDEDVRAPYRPFIEAIEHLVASAPADVLRSHIERHGSNILPLAPGLRLRVDPLPEPPSIDQETGRFLMFAAVADLLAALSERSPVVLFLDDLHWADAGTVSLLRSLATATEPARLLVTGTFRSEELSGEHPMGQALAVFRRVESVSRLQLGGLRSSEILELVEQWTGTDGGSTAERLVADLMTETGGNAFFVTEVMRHLEETGQLSQLSDSASVPQTLVPESIREVLGERVARMGSVADTVLAVAAVIGSEFALPLLAAVTGLEDQKLMGVLEAAAAAALVGEVQDAPGRFVFTHGLVQQAILINVGPTREAALHRRVAEVLEANQEGSVPAAELAHHWLQATTVSDHRRARDWARQAGDAALAALAPADGVAFYRQALLLHDQLRDDDVVTRIDLLTKLGTAERQSGDPEYRDTLLRACRLSRRIDDGERLAEAALANNSGTFSTFQGVDREQVEMLEAAIASGNNAGRRAILLGTLANELTYSGDFSHRRQLVDDALQAARASGDKALLLRVSNLVFYGLWIPETLEERLALTEESLGLVKVVDDPLQRYWAASANYLNLVQAGRVHESEPLLGAIGDLSDRLAQPALQWRARHTHSTRRLLAGDPDVAEALAHEALELGNRAGEPEAVVYFKSQMMCIFWQRGKLDQLAVSIKGGSPRPPNALASLCLIFAEGGREYEASTFLDQVAEGSLNDLPHDPAYIACVTLFAEAAIHLRHGRAAAVLYDRILPFGEQVGFDGVTTVGALGHHLGGLASVLGHHDEAVGHLRRSCAIHDHIGARFFEARDRFELARALSARGAEGDAGAALEELRRSVAIARTHEYEFVHQQGRDLLTDMTGA